MLLLTEAEEGDMAGSQRQTCIGLEGHVDDGQMKEGIAWRAALGYRDYDTFRKL